MDWQLAAVALCLLAATTYVVYRVWREWTGKSPGCASGCGKCAAPAQPSPEDGRRIRLL